MNDFLQVVGMLGLVIGIAFFGGCVYKGIVDTSCQKHEPFIIENTIYYCEPETKNTKTTKED